jgi:multiple sugar transport system permease protein
MRPAALFGGLPRASRARRRRAPWWQLAGEEAILVVGAILMVMPFAWMLSTALKSPAEILQWPPSFIPENPSLANFFFVFENAPFARWLLNSLILAVSSTVAILLTSALAGYVLAKFTFPGRGALFVVILATAIVPFEVYMIPLYLTSRDLGLINTMPGVILPFVVMSFGIFFVRQNVLASIPDELIEAGRIDGASESWIFLHVVVPLLGGPLSALGIFAFMQAWNQFVWPLLVANSKMLYTAEVGLALFQTGYTVDFGAVSAGSVISVLPILIVFLALRRRIIDGVALSGLKG